MLAEAPALCAALLAATSAGVAPAVELRPTTLVLGTGESVRVRVRSEAAPRLVTSAGEVRPLRQVEPGVFEAVLDPPAETYPQLALVAAIGAAGVGYAWLPLVGRGVAVAKTTPGASVTVSIRDRVFGPAQADGRGVAHIPVVVPPGVRYAYQRGKPLDLKVPPLRRAHVVVDLGDGLRADRAEVVTVYAFAATPEGAPLAGAPLALSVTAGELGPAREIGAGAVAAQWTLPPGAAGTVAVEARLPDVPPARDEVVRAAGVPARLALALAAERAAAGDPPIEVSVRIADAAGNAVDGPVSLRASSGTISAFERAAPGLVRARLRPPERLEGVREAVVEAALGELTERRALLLAPAAPSSLRVEILQPELVADGDTSSEVRIAVSDRFGNGVDAPAPTLEAARGRLAPPSREAPGAYRTQYAPRRQRDGGEDAVVVRAGGLVAREPVRLLAPARYLAATARAGALHAFGGFTGPLVSAAVEAWPLRLGGAYGLSVGIGLAASSREDRVDAGATPHAVGTSSVLWPLEVTALSRRRLGERLTATTGAGGRLVGIRATAALDGRRLAEEWGWALGVHGQAGVALELPRWHARVGADLVLAWQQDPGMRSVRGDLGTLAVTLGFTHDAL